MESDSEDDVYDWSSLGARVLKRGEKDHAPDGTVVQQSYIQKSRDAMYLALGYTSHTSEKNLLEADWLEERQLGCIRKQKGNSLMTMGWSESTQLLVYPEELIYLCQRGSLICYNRGQELDLAGVMALCMNTSLNADKMAVYSNLKKLGFIVRRPAQTNLASTQSSSLTVPSNLELVPSVPSQSVCSAILWFLFGQWLPKLAWQPVYTSFSSIYKDLRAVSLKPINQTSVARSEVSDFDFYAWKPGTKFKKTNPPNPDFNVRVVNAGKLPELSVIERDFANTGTVNEFRSMKFGFRNYISAVVDNGVVSYVRMTETAAPSIA